MQVLKLTLMLTLTLTMALTLTLTSGVREERAVMADSAVIEVRVEGTLGGLCLSSRDCLAQVWTIHL